MLRLSLAIALWIHVILGSSLTAANADPAATQIVAEFAPQTPADYGLQQLGAALTKRDLTWTRIDWDVAPTAPIVVFIGLASNEAVAREVRLCGMELPSEPESLVIGRRRAEGTTRIVVCGADEVGLMYAALTMAEQIGWNPEADDPLGNIQPTRETPYLRDRSVSTYTMQRRQFEKHLYDAEYWRRYFDLLARSRINSYVIIFGYENGGFMAPIYPYFFDVDGFANVKLYGMTADQQARNRRAFHRVIQLAHQRGIRLTIGIWDHIYRGGVQAGGIAGASERAGTQTPHLVSGVTKDNLAAYTKAALRHLLSEFPDLDGIQFRMHWESGLTRKETPGFWHEVISMLHAARPKMQFDLRAKGLPDIVIDDAVAQQLPFRIATKYWMEQMGLPFHPTHINPQNQRDRRHGYADLLRYPRRYPMHWRLWSGGTTRFLLWGDPDYVRQFAESAQVYDGQSFEVNEMLATKMLGAPHDEQPFALLREPHRYYDYEFERYWYFYQVWGRVAYQPRAADQIGRHEFARRFGDPAGELLRQALHSASRVLPRIVAASYNYRFFPTTRGWAEVMRLGDLSLYAQGTGTDIAQFEGYQEAAARLLKGEATCRRSPFATAQWFEQTAARVLEHVHAATAAAPKLDDQESREFLSTICDLKILAGLARFHAWRMRAAVWFNVYQQTKDAAALKRCVDRYRHAIDAWKSIIEVADGVYSDTLKFGVHRVGFSYHWKEELTPLIEDLDKVRQLPAGSQLEQVTIARLEQSEGGRRRAPVGVRLEPVNSPRPGLAVTIRVHCRNPTKWKSVRLRYRHVTQFEDYKSLEMVWSAAERCYQATIPDSFVVDKWDLMYYVELWPPQGDGYQLPDLESGMPYRIVTLKR